MKLASWIGIVGCLGIGAGVAMAAQGCTATLTVGPCDGGCGQIGDDSSFPGEDGGNLPDTSPGPDATSIDAGSTPPDPCNSCLYTQCVGAYSNCVGNTSCLTAYQCATSPACALDGGNCVQDCVNAATPAGQNLYGALADCDFFAQCAQGGATAPCTITCNPAPDTCALPDSGTPDSGTDAGQDAGQTCAQCQATACGTQLDACKAGTACASYNECVLGCTTAACSSACATNNPSGVAAANALGSCTSSSCPVCTQ